MGHVCEPPSIPNQQSWLCKAWAHRFFEIQRENLWFLLCVEVISVDTAVPEEHGIAQWSHFYPPTHWKFSSTEEPLCGLVKKVEHIQE